MAVYVDNFDVAAEVANGKRTVRGRWSHMTADTREELDAMADRIGLRRSWIQYPGTWKEHYDVTAPKKVAAIAAGAVEVSALEHTRDFLAPRRERIDSATAPGQGAQGGASGPAAQRAVEDEGEVF